MRNWERGLQIGSTEYQNLNLMHFDLPTDILSPNLDMKRLKFKRLHPEAELLEKTGSRFDILVSRASNFAFICKLDR